MIVEVVDSRLGSLSDFMDAHHPDLLFKAERFALFKADLIARDFLKYILPVKRYLGGSVVVADPLGDRNMLMFCLADYLDLARHPRTIEAAQCAVQNLGNSVSSVPLIAGATDVHKQFEAEMARFLGAEDCVVFPTGQQANVAAISALCNARDFIVIDKQVHASVLEGVKLSAAKWKTFRHSDSTHLDGVLRGVRAKGHNRGILVVAEGIYGLDGDVTPLPEIMSVCERHDARLFIDDAHATGVLGPHAAGTHDHFGLKCPDILMGSLSKAFGSVGGWIAASKKVTDYLRFYCGSLVFSVGAPPAAIAASLTALRIIQTDKALLAKLQLNSKYLKEALLSTGIKNARLSSSAIVSARIDSEPILRDVVRELYEEQLWAEGLPFPATMRGQERVRLRARASHTTDELDRAAEIIGRVFSRHGLIGGIAVAGADLKRNAVDHDTIVSLVIEEADSKHLRLNWMTRDFFRKIVGAEFPWGGAIGQNRWFLHYSGDHLVACVRGALLSLEGSDRVGTVGDIHWLRGEEQHVTSLLLEACDWLKSLGTKRVVGPLQPPMQILGAGILSHDSADSPFLEPLHDSRLSLILTNLDFVPAFVNEYTLRQISRIDDIKGDSSPADVSLRHISRERLFEDVDALEKTFNDGIGNLFCCTPLRDGSLAGIAMELRELIVPEFWVIAEDKEKQIVAFAGGFPDLGSAFRDVGGAGDISDLEFLKAAVDSTKRGFLAWSSAINGRGRGAATAACWQVLKSMRQRGYSDAWTSWELLDAGPICFDKLDVRGRARFEVFGRELI